MHMSCIKGRPKLIAEGLHRKVYRIQKFVLKIEKGESFSDLKTIHERALSIDAHQRKVRKEFTFFPKYYGTLTTAMKTRREYFRRIITVHEYVEPLPHFSVKTIQGVLKILREAFGKRYFLDPKLSNFGRRGERVFYLDEYGIGKFPIPPDLLEDLNKLVRAIPRQLIGQKVLSKKQKNPVLTAKTEEAFRKYTTRCMSNKRLLSMVSHPPHRRKFAN